MSLGSLHIDILHHHILQSEDGERGKAAVNLEQLFDICDDHTGVDKLDTVDRVHDVINNSLDVGVVGQQLFQHLWLDSVGFICGNDALVYFLYGIVEYVSECGCINLSVICIILRFDYLRHISVVESLRAFLVDIQRTRCEHRGGAFWIALFVKSPVQPFHHLVGLILVLACRASRLLRQ